MRTQCNRIMACMQYAALLSRGEAEACIRDLRRGDNYSGEAVNHFGGTRDVFRSAMRLRHFVRGTPQYRVWRGYDRRRQPTGV